jgi:hypothetical protein
VILPDVACSTARRRALIHSTKTAVACRDLVAECGHFVHDSCMGTRTITVELDAYERLRSAKRPGESFSEVVRRAIFPSTAPTGEDLLTWFRSGGSGASAHYLDLVAEADTTDQPPDDAWR